MNLPSQLLFKYTDTNTGGTVKKSTTEFTSSQNQSLSLAAINWRGGGWKKGERNHMRKTWPAFTQTKHFPQIRMCVICISVALEADDRCFFQQSPLLVMLPTDLG